MRLLLFANFAIIFSLNVCAQQPFEQYGYKVKVLTLSQGKYEEFFDQDTIVQIGSIMFKTVTNTITGFAVQDTVYSEANFEPQIISKFLSPDPLANQYYDLSPYHFVANNPIKYTDPDGKQIVDANGNIVKVLINEDDEGNRTASFEFAEGTKNNVIRKFNRNAGKLINTLIGTDKGTSMVKDAEAANDHIQVTLSSEVRTDRLGATQREEVVDANLNKIREDIEVIVYQGSIDALSRPTDETVKASEVGKQTIKTLDLWKANKLNRNQKAASVFGHELHHATKDGGRKTKLSWLEHLNGAYSSEEVIVKEFGDKNKGKEKKGND